MGKFCPKCGNSANNNDKFCMKCGTPLKFSQDDSYDTELYKPDRGIWEMFFKFKGRVNPKRYLIRLMFISIIFYSIFFLSVIFLKDQHLLGMISMITSLSIFILMIPLNVRRCHDLGRPGWYFMLIPIPIIFGAVEVAMVRRGWWYNKWGEYREHREITEWSLLLSIFYFIIVSTVGMLMFIFSSGVPGENEYGADPTGACAKVPDQTNPILGFLSRLEEETSSLVVGILILGILCLPGLVLSSLNKKSNFTSTPKPKIENSVSTPQSNSAVATQPKEERSQKDLKLPPNQNNKIVAQPLKNQNQNDAVYVLTSFHDSITKKNYRQAYNNCLSREFKSEMSYEGWIPGFDTTVSSEVSDIKVQSETNNEIVLTYILKAVDNIRGKEQTEYFNGTVTLIKENGSWKIDRIKNKVKK